MGKIAMTTKAIYRNTKVSVGKKQLYWQLRNENSVKYDINGFVWFQLQKK